MTTYSTIDHAFKNGTGDVFFAKDGKTFIAVSRKDDNNYLIAEGFVELSYDEVVSFARSQKKVVESDKVAMQIVSNSQYGIIPKKMVRSYSSHDGYYDEFPDAYGQNL